MSLEYLGRKPHWSGAATKTKTGMKPTYRGKQRWETLWPQREMKKLLCGIVRIAALRPINIPFCLSNLLRGPTALSSLGSASYFHILTINPFY